MAMTMLPKLSKGNLAENARAGRWLLAVRSEGDWAIYKIAFDHSRLHPNMLFVYSDEYFSSDGDTIHDWDEEKHSSFPVVYDYYIRAIFPDEDAARAAAKKMEEIDAKFADETAKARISYQLGALTAINAREHA